MASNSPGTSASAPHTEQSFNTYDTARYAIDYKAHKRPALRKLVLDRAGRVEPGNFSRQHYIDVLEDDYIRKATFKFLDLPAELRNEIYAHLLILRNKKPKPRYWKPARTVFCFPAILQASRLVHKEASSILYGENTAEILISNWGNHSPGPRQPRKQLSEVIIKRCKEAAVLRADLFDEIEFLVEDRGPYYRRTTPDITSRLLRFKNVKITIDTDLKLKGPNTDRSPLKERPRLVNVSHTLLALASSLRTSEKLKALTLEIKWPVNSEELLRRDAMLPQALWPLSLITNCKSVIITGVDRQLADVLKPIYSGERVDLDILANMRELVKKREAIVQRAVKSVGTDLLYDFQAYEADRIGKSILLSSVKFVNVGSFKELEQEIQQLERDVGGGLCKRARQWARSQRQDERHPPIQ